MRRKTIFEPNKGLKFASRPIVRLGTSTISDKKTRLNTNCLPDRKRGLSCKTKKRSRDAWGPNNRGDILVIISGKKKGDIDRPKIGRGYWITGLEITAADVDNL